MMYCVRMAQMHIRWLSALQEDKGQPPIYDVWMLLMKMILL